MEMSLEQKMTKESGYSYLQNIPQIQDLIIQKNSLPEEQSSFLRSRVSKPDGIPLQKMIEEISTTLHPLQQELKI
tara:strand:- start:125 stop:349 length:225 start_codon:yes stop_codon:yes gene_type:complete